MEYKEVSAKTVDEAITKACIELGITSDKLDYEVLSEGSSGFLGIGKSDAVIRYREKALEQPGEVRKTEDKGLYEADSNFVSAEDIEARAAAAAQRDKELNDLHGGSGSATHGGYTSRFGSSTDRSERPRTRNDRRQESRGRNARRGSTQTRGRHDRDNRGRGGRRDRMRDDDLSRLGARILEVENPHEPSVPKPPRTIAPKTDEEVQALEKKAVTFLDDVFKAMDLRVQVSMDYDQEEGSLNCLFDGEDMGLLIGKHGQTLDSLQYLTSLVINRGETEYIRVKLDTEDYRKRRKETLVNLSRNIAYKVRKTHHAIALEPMNPYERRIIHSALQEEDDIETYSEGEEPYRHVVVTLKKK